MKTNVVKDFGQMLSMFLEPLHVRDRLKAGMACRALREASRNIRIYVDNDIERALEKAQSLETLVLRPGTHIIRKPLTVMKSINIEGLMYPRSKRDLLCALRGTNGLLRCQADSEYREYALRDFSQWVGLYSGGMSGRPVHIIPIYASSRVVASSTHSSSFVVITFGKKYKIEAKTAAEQSVWVNSLRHVVNMLDLTSVRVEFKFDNSNISPETMSWYSSNAITLGGLRGSIQNVSFSNGDINIVHRGTNMFTSLQKSK